MGKATSGLCVTALAGLLLPMGLLADNHEEPKAIADVWMIVPKQGMESEFEAAAKAHMAFRAQQDDSRHWAAFQPVVGHKISIYGYRACCYDWADLDAYEAEEADKAFNENWGENVHQYVDHYHHYLEQIDWENSNWPEGDRTAGPYYGVTTWKLKMNTGPGPDEARKALSQLAKNEGWADDHEWLWIYRMAGAPTIMLVTPHESYASMEEPDPTFFEFASEKMGSEEEAGALFNQFGTSFASEDFTIWKRNDELSDPREDE